LLAWLSKPLTIINGLMREAILMAIESAFPEGISLQLGYPGVHQLGRSGRALIDDNLRSRIAVGKMRSAYASFTTPVAAIRLTMNALLSRR
jgi:hypothetical protein